MLLRCRHSAAYFIDSISFDFNPEKWGCRPQLTAESLRWRDYAVCLRFHTWIREPVWRLASRVVAEFWNQSLRLQYPSPEVQGDSPLQSLALILSGHCPNRIWIALSHLKAVCLYFPGSLSMMAFLTQHWSHSQKWWAGCLLVLRAFCYFREAQSNLYKFSPTLGRETYLNVWVRTASESKREIRLECWPHKQEDLWLK